MKLVKGLVAESRAKRKEERVFLPTTGSDTPPLPSGTVTFLFTDVVGSTQLWEQHPDTMPGALARHETIVGDAIKRHGGYVFKTVGDAFCAAFPTAHTALEAAVDAQTGLHTEHWDLPQPLKVRMALHSGACEERSGDYFGPSVNRVARLMAAGHGGQVLLSGAAQELVRDALPSAVTLRDMDRHRLRDLGRPEQVYQIVHPGLPAEFAPLRTLDSADLPNNLPQQVTSFIGREQEVPAIEALLQKGRLVTLVGTGGAGKSRLSLQVAADLLGGFPDGVWLVELAPLSDPASVAQAVAAAVSVREEPGKRLSETLPAALKTKHLLLILDNCEHLLPACAALAESLLRGCPHLKVLASSREALNISGEQVYRIPALSLPATQQGQTADSLTQYEAVRLFIDRAQAVQPAFTVTDANAPAVAQICFHLDGVPLALELAAARIRSLPAEQVLARLDDRFRLLTGGSRVALPRQQTLRALIDWSYDLLSGPEKSLLCQVSVFVGGWTLDAAERVCGGEALDLLTSLVDKSLVIYSETGDGQSRYGLLETMRQYAAERLAEHADEAQSTPARHAAWALALAEQAKPHLVGAGAGLWLARLDAEHDNLRAALSWQSCQPEGAEAGLRLAGALSQFWIARGHYTEGRRLLETALSRREAAPEPSVSPAVRATALGGIGILASSQSDYPAAQTYFEESLALRREIGDREGIGSALSNLGVVFWFQGDLKTAQEFYTEGLALNRETGDTHGAAKSLYNLAILAFEQDDYSETRPLLEEAAAMFREIGDLRSQSFVLNSLGSLFVEQKNWDAAQAIHEQNLELARQLNDPLLIGDALAGLGNTLSNHGDYAAATSRLNEALSLRLEMGDKRNASIALMVAAFIAAETNRPLRAARIWGAVEALCEQIGSPLVPRQQVEMDAVIAKTRAGAEDAAFTAAWTAGHTLSWQDAVAYARSEAD